MLIKSPKTQKAKGIAAMLDYSDFQRHNAKPLKVRVHDASKPVDLFFERGYFDGKQIFARPCPVTPQHGFVESRVVNNFQELEKLRAETIAADPNAEIILSPLIDASLNFVLANNLLTIGPGHDGATSGINTLNFPLVSFNNSSIKKACGIDSKDSMFIEAVFGEELIFTQVRGGPVTSNSVDYIPQDTEVKSIVDIQKWQSEHSDKATELLEWQKFCQNFEAGTVVFHNGGSPTSHFAIHCVSQKIPYLTSKRPEIGEILKSEVVGEPDKTAFKLAFKEAMHAELNVKDARPLMQFVLYVTHNIAVFNMANPWHARLFGLACGLAVRFGSLACHGEYRHSLKSKESRDTLYLQRINKNETRLLPKFLFHFMFGQWSSGYGGPKWAKCTLATIKLFNACGRGKFDEAIKALNIIVNEAHNGGKFFNKFLTSDDFNAFVEPFHVMSNFNILFMATNLTGKIVNRSQGSIKPLEFFLSKRDTIKLPATITDGHIVVKQMLIESKTISRSFMWPCDPKIRYYPKFEIKINDKNHFYHEDLEFGSVQDLLPAEYKDVA